MEEMTINEPVDVGAVFGKNSIRPKWFLWNNRKYPVKEITYVWREGEGEARCMHFAVTDGSTVFELSFNLKTMLWHLEKTVLNA